MPSTRSRSSRWSVRSRKSASVTSFPPWNSCSTPSLPGARLSLGQRLGIHQQDRGRVAGEAAGGVHQVAFAAVQRQCPRGKQERRPGAPALDKRDGTSKSPSRSRARRVDLPAASPSAGRGRPAVRQTPPAHNGWTPREARLPRTTRHRFALPGAQRVVRKLFGYSHIPQRSSMTSTSSISIPISTSIAPASSRRPARTARANNARSIATRR